ncbi:O-antigen ligase family protein [Planosporangium sp. 12N6]|uniref:O-antigen ligase family protein n=1 Tax=Planosporangium spinosum TaxID=3402278 RepID=UPI003CF7E542
MTNRIAIVAGTVVALACAAVEFVHSQSALYASGALVAGALAAAIAWFVTTLPSLTLRGLVTGGFFVLAGMLSWTSLGFGPWLVWPLLAVEGVVFAWWSWPWLRDLRVSYRLGTTWLGVAYWILGTVGALLVAKLGIGVQRLVYAGVFGLAVLAVIAGTRRGRGRDLSVGIVGAFLLAIALLFVSGSGNLFQYRHVVPPSGWGTEVMVHRFWGGSWLLYHPNSLALIAVVAAMRIGVDRVFAVWQRVAVTLLAGGVVYLTNSRTGFVYFAAAAVVHGYLLLRRRGEDLPAYRRVWLAAAVPFAVTALVLVLSEAGGQSFLFKARYDAGDVTSGRTDTWKQVGRDWVNGNVVVKLLGDTGTARAVVIRDDDGHKPGEKPLQLTTDNAAVGALRRGGVLGELAFLLGLGLLLARAWRGSGDRAPAAWLTVTAIGAVPTIATADWLLGGTGGTLWILLVAGEAWLVLRPAPAGATEPEPELTPAP